VSADDPGLSERAGPAGRWSGLVDRHRHVWRVSKKLPVRDCQRVPHPRGGGPPDADCALEVIAQEVVCGRGRLVRGGRRSERRRSRRLRREDLREQCPRPAQRVCEVRVCFTSCCASTTSDLLVDRTQRLTSQMAGTPRRTIVVGPSPATRAQKTPRPSIRRTLLAINQFEHSVHGRGRRATRPARPTTSEAGSGRRAPTPAVRRCG
jgi:hypothetical protein